MYCNDFLALHPKWAASKGKVKKLLDTYQSMCGPRLLYNDCLQEIFVLNQLEFNSCNLVTDLQKLVKLRLTIAKAEAKEKE